MKSKAGFSLTELMVVLAIVLVVGGVSVPTIARSLEQAKLKSAAVQIADIYQQARMRSAQDNSYHEVLVTPPGALPAQVCVDLNGDGQCGANDPASVLPGQVRLISAGTPSVLDSTALGFYALTNDTSITYNQQNMQEHALAWNSLGLPCQRTSTTSACAAVGWVQYLQLQRTANDSIFAAVSVSPTGRVRIWNYNSGGGWN